MDMQFLRFYTLFGFWVAAWLYHVCSANGAKNIPMRIDNFISMPSFNCIFKPEQKPDLPTEIENLIEIGRAHV
jgi:hypothetical protein